MAEGYNGKILRVNLTSGNIETLEQDEDFYRRYYGGRGFIGYYLLNELEPGIVPLSPDNKLIFATGIITGGRIAGSGRSSVGAKSPLTNAYGEAEAGGFFGVELKRAGYDAVIVEGKAGKPVYLWIHDKKVELRSASHLWGKTTLESQEIIHQELGDKLIRTAQIGPAGENLVRFACIMNDVHYAYGRAGMGTVMGSKNLKAIATRGHRSPKIADLAKIKSIIKWLNENYSKSFQDTGTAGGLLWLNKSGGLPTRNFQEGSFEGAEAISGQTMRDTILINRGGCYACPIRCKRVVKVDGLYQVNPEYGGPEYETLGSFGSNCGIDDLAAISKANEICNAYSLDTISAGTTIAFAMECFENGILTESDTGGIELRFGNADAMVKMVEMIAKREGFGDVLAEGAMRAAQKIGKDAEKYAMHIKGQELPMHEPRYKQGMGMGYAISPTGADHTQSIHDSGGGPGKMVNLGVLDELPADDLSAKKVRMFVYEQHWKSFGNCAGLCMFLPYSYNQIAEIVQALTGWDVTTWELMKVGERGTTMARAFNMREGLTTKDDYLPDRFHVPFTSGPLKDIAVGEKKLKEAMATYYGMMGWDENGVPTKAKLQELDIEWISEVTSS